MASTSTERQSQFNSLAKTLRDGVAYLESLGPDQSYTEPSLADGFLRELAERTGVEYEKSVPPSQKSVLDMDDRELDAEIAKFGILTRSADGTYPSVTKSLDLAMRLAVDFRVFDKFYDSTGSEEGLVLWRVGNKWQLKYVYGGAILESESLPRLICWAILKYRRNSYRQPARDSSLEVSAR